MTTKQTHLLFLLVAAPLLIAASVRADGLELTATLGEQNICTGLAVPSGGDGSNVPETIASQSVRRIKNGHSIYMYVVVTGPASFTGPIDCYVTVEAYDDVLARVGLQYDKASPKPDLHTKYTDSGQVLFLTGSKQWRRGVFHLPDLRLGHGQNSNADFRLVGANVAVRKITLTTTRPAGYDPDHLIDRESLEALAVHRRSGMALTYGNDASPADAAIDKALSITSIESYVDWSGVEPEEGRWDWSKWDKQVATLQKAGLKWVPFLIAGPAYATPKWFQDSPDSHVYRCLEHDRDSKVQTLFNPKLRPRIERFLQAFADHYRDSGVIESVLLGITGIYGESIYPAGPEGGWTADRTGAYHNHGGWWAGDPLAVAAFRAAMRERYTTISALNKTWNTSHASFDDVKTFLPVKAPNDRARADFVEWYEQVMTDWSVFWVKSARAAFPKTDIYLCTGGDGNPELGADFTAQVKAIAPFGAGVRITNEGSDYAANFTVTREVATATRLYGTFCGFEPASSVDAKGVVGRIYNATASGARQLHDYAPNTLGSATAALQNLRTYLPFLVPRHPHIEAALYLSRESWPFDTSSIGRAYALARALRDIADIDFVTRRSVSDGLLKTHRVLVLAESPVLEPSAAAAIEKWVRDGGTLLAIDGTGQPVTIFRNHQPVTIFMNRQALATRLHDNAAWRERVLGKAEPIKATDLVVPTLDGPAPAHWVLPVGSETDQRWLIGEWNGREAAHEWPELPGATMRWSGARCGVLLPVHPGAEYVLRLSLSPPPLSLGKNGISVRVNDQKVSTITKPGKQQVEFRLPASVLGKGSVARLEFTAQSWRPSEHDPKSSDARLLGFSLRQVDVARVGSLDAPPAPAGLKSVVDTKQLAKLTKTIGKGRAITLAGLPPDQVAAVFGSLLGSPVDGQLDGRYATVTDTGTLWLDPAVGRIWETEPRK